MGTINESMTLVGGGFVTAAVGAAGLWLANRVMGKAAFQAAITTGFAELHKLEQSARETLQADMATLRADMMTERARAAVELQTERARCDENLAQVARIVAGLKRLLAQHGIEVPEEGVLLQGANYDV